jgi:hypothetical protein
MALHRAEALNLVKAQKLLPIAKSWETWPVQPKPPTYPILFISFQGPTQEFQRYILILI